MKVDILTFCTILLGYRGVIEPLILNIALDLMSMINPCPCYGSQGGSPKKIAPSKNIDKLKVVVSWEGGLFDINLRPKVFATFQIILMGWYLCTNI